MSDWDRLLIAIAEGTEDQMLDQIVNVLGSMADRMIMTTNVDPCAAYGCIAQNMMLRMANMNHKECALHLIGTMKTQLESFNNVTPH